MNTKVLEIFGTVPHFYSCPSPMKQLQTTAYPKSPNSCNECHAERKTNLPAALVSSSPTNECIVHLHMLCRAYFKRAVRKASDYIKND